MKRLLSLPAIGIMLTLLLANKIATAQTYFTVEVVGKGKPMILIHGLYCNGDVWKETVEHYKKDDECHIITLAGFGGNAPQLNDHFLESVKDDVINYVKTKKLKKPIVMGHSMGAFLSLSWQAERKSDTAHAATTDQDCKPRMTFPLSVGDRPDFVHSWVRGVIGAGCAQKNNPGRRPCPASAPRGAP